MKAVITCPFIPIAARPGSHRASQGVIYADLIRQSGVDISINWGGRTFEDHNQFDTMYVYHGSDWSGGLNLFGGVKAFPYAWNIRNFSQFKGTVISLGIPFPPYHEMIGERIETAKKKGNSIQPEWLEVDLKNLERMHKNSQVVKFPFKTHKVVIGDSHAICMHRPGWTVNSVPFTTLHGAIERGFKMYIDPVDEIQHVTDLECYFGNIDLRHHLIRLEGDPYFRASKLALDYVQAISALPIPNKSIYELLPIENESRKLPKTGYHKGKPFWGSWTERNNLRKFFCDVLEAHCQTGKDVKFIRWTDYLLNHKGELDFKHMEQPHSIHLSREFYPHWNGIDTFSTPKKLSKVPHKPELLEVPHNSLETFFA